MLQGLRSLGPGPQPALVYFADLSLAAAVLAGQRNGDFHIWHRVALGEVLALCVALAEVFHAADDSAAKHEDFAVASAPRTGGAQVLKTGVNRGLRHRRGWVVELVNRVLERQRLEAALLARSWVQRPPHLGSALGCALSFPELAASQAQRHVVYDRSRVTVSCVRILEVHERDATSIGQDAFPFILV